MCIDAMKSSGDMDAVSYNTAEAVPWHRHSAVVVEALLHKMQKAGFQPNIATCNSVLCDKLADGDFVLLGRRLISWSLMGQVSMLRISILYEAYKQKRCTMDV